jgi:undecaprenyl-diphosphatase
MRRTVAVVALGFVGLFLLLIGAGFLLRIVAGRGPTGADRTVTDWFVDLRTPWLTDAVKSVQFLGRSELLLVVVAVAGVLLATRHARSGVVLVLACAGAETMVDVVKPLVGRARPPVRLWLEATARGAFPSGHALISMTIALATVAAVGLATGRRPPRWAWAVGTAVSGVVGLGRVYLGVHWITDVLGGWAAGAAWVSLLVATVGRPPRAPEVISSRPAVSPSP